VAFDKTQPAYQAFRSQYAERTRSIVVWIGSGLSVPAGLPSWPALRDTLVGRLERKLATIHPPDDKNAQLLQRARSNGDLWSAFQILKRALGPASFSAAIRDELSSAETAAVPPAYGLIWKLRISGVLNLNLDRLATKAFSEIRPGKQVNEFVGRRAGAYAHLLQSPTVPFIANVHGILPEENSWVLTRSDLNDLLKNNGYRQFVAGCLTARTVLFVGLTADDVAISGHLAALRAAGVSFGSHYWLTARTDQKTDVAAERLGLQVIRYTAVDDDHGPVQEMLGDLAAYISEDSPPPPVMPSAPRAIEDLASPDALLQRSPAELREVLNRHAAELLAHSDAQAYANYESFRHKYDRAIYQAWYTSTQPGENYLLGYRLDRVIGRGAFGEVFEAETSAGEKVAVKVLHQEVRKSPGMLESFRRGVRSMRILSERKIDGMVPYRAAAEIPAFAVMDLVHGPNLKTAVESSLVTGWVDIMKVAVELANTVRRAHALPERVLHRDLRPSNIMLEGLFEGSDDWHVVVLDFDLSWHREAAEKSVIDAAAATGYLAPEQLQPIRGISTRSSAVDSYGFGMTLYFVITGKEPTVGQHQSVAWTSRLDAVRQTHCSSWHSLPLRIARLIDNSTRHVQAERWDMSQIERELERLSNAMAKPRTVESAELIAEELMSRTRYRDTYAWNPDKLEVSLDLPTGTVVQLQGRESDRQIRLNFVWTKAKGRKVNRYVTPAVEQAKALLSKAGWTITADDRGAQQAHLGAAISVETARAKLVEIARSVECAVEKLQLA
jgi:serine/threonine protein kinase